MSKHKRMVPLDAEVGSIDPALFKTHSGIEILNKMVAGEIPGPPIARLMDFTLCEVSEGFSEFRGIPSAEHYNPGGTVHGGWPATILDSALGCCVQTLVPAGSMFTTIEIKVNLVRPLFDNTGEVICQGNVIHFGKTTATAEAKLTRGDGKLLAHGTTTCAVFKVP